MVCVKRIFNQTGASLVLFSIAIVLILGIAALVIDIGITMYEKEKLSNAIDSAALAAMQKINEDNETVINTAKEYAQLNGVDPDAVNITIAPDRKSIRVESTKTVQYFFARVLGINQENVTFETGVKTAPIKSAKGMRPLTIADQQLILNQQYILKEDSGDGQAGNYGALALGGNGAGVYRDNLLNGYNSTLKVGDIVYTETGNITQATIDGIQQLIGLDPDSTYQNFKPGSPRVIIMPIVNTLDLNGKKPILVVGFAAFFLEEMQGSGGNAEIVGRFVNYMATGDSSDSQADYGLRAIKLTN